MSVFVLTDPQKLVEMAPAHFVTEDEFQQLLANFPELLGGDRINGDARRRWLLIKREKSVPAEEGGGGRWSLDHLFVDQDGVPTLVEVKRQSDTRLRREVVGQMLDYAANAVVYWPVEQLQAEFEDGCTKNGTNPEEVIRDRLGIVGGAEALWRSVKTNLQAGNIRLLFVADRIPSELRRIVEFLNKQMDPAEVLALELRQFQGEGLKTIVPVLYGQTEEAQTRKGIGAPKRQWDEETFFTDFSERHTPEAQQIAQKILGWMKKNGDEVVFGRGTKDGSASIMVLGGGQKNYPMSILTYGRVEIEFQYLMRGPFEAEDRRRELLARLNGVDGLSLPANSISRRPTFSLTLLSTGDRLAAFLSVMDWLVEELRSVS
jgi:hypothetical protein